MSHSSLKKKIFFFIFLNHILYIRLILRKNRLNGLNFEVTGAKFDNSRIHKKPGKNFSQGLKNRGLVVVGCKKTGENFGRGKV